MTNLYMCIGIYCMQPRTYHGIWPKRLSNDYTIISIHLNTFCQHRLYILLHWYLEILIQFWDSGNHTIVYGWCLTAVRTASRGIRTLAYIHRIGQTPQYPYNSFEFLPRFYTPVWKTGRIMPWQCPSVRLSVRLSVRPSVRPRFPDFSSTCFEISIWNLVYAFSRWHDMSSLSCITIGSIWPSLQPKVGQTYFLQSWPHKSR